MSPVNARTQRLNRVENVLFSLGSFRREISTNALADALIELGRILMEEIAANERGGEA